MEHKWNATFKNVENFVQAWADEWERQSLKVI